MDHALERELIERAGAGDARAWDVLFDRHYAATARFIWQLSPKFTQEDVEEICQEVFLNVIRTIRSFRGNSQLQTWIFRIAANKARDYRDKETAQKRGGGITPVSLDAENPETGLTLEPPTATSGPDETLMSAESALLVHESLNQLGEPCREVIELRYFADLSYEEIAATLDLNVKTVSSRLSKCLHKLEGVLARTFEGERTGAFPV